MRRAALICICGAAIGLLAAGAASSASLSKATVQTRNIKGLGTVLVNSRGDTLYMFVPDKRKRVTCKGSCAAVWPPLKLKAGQKATAGGAARKSLLGSDKDPSGGRVVTYAGWPLYTYVGDGKPGQANGQGLDSTGGYWYVLSPAGKVIKKKP